MTMIRRRRRVRTTMTMVVVNDFLDLYYQTYNICQKYVTIRLNSKVKCVLTRPYEILLETYIYSTTVHSKFHIPQTLFLVLMGKQYTHLISDFYLRNPAPRTLKKHRNRHSHNQRKVTTLSKFSFRNRQFTE
jgi:hypothetical protein